MNNKYEVSYDLEKVIKYLENLNNKNKLNSINMYTLGLIYID